jgi:hypothetical protein
VKYAIIVWTDEAKEGNGTVYGWYESLGNAVMTALHLRGNGSFWHAVVVRMV